MVQQNQNPEREEMLKYRLRRLIQELESFRARHTEFVSVYVPQGYDLISISKLIADEIGTASNIKSSSTRENVTSALEKVMSLIRQQGRTPQNGIAFFAGNLSAHEGKQDFRGWAIEPPYPLNLRLYRCDQVFFLDPLKEFLDSKSVYAILVMDKREANMALLKGKTLQHIFKLTSIVPGKYKTGGQCLSPDSLIQLADGDLIPIKFSHNPHKVKSVLAAKDFQIKDSNITNKWQIKKNKIYKIITKNPRLEVQSSKDHTFFVSTNNGIIQKPAEKLTIKDYLIMPEKIDVKAKPQNLYPKKYYNSFIITKQGQELLKKKRLEKGLLQRQLAKKVDLFQTTISFYEIGRQKADRDSLKRVCTKLKINFEEFLNKYTKPSTFKGKSIKLPAILNKDLAQFLGYFTGDGSIEIDRITFFEQNRQVAQEYKRKYDKSFKINSSYKFRESKNYHQIRFTSRPLVRLIKNEFPEIRGSLDSQIPDKILKSPNNIIASFLKGLFDADGYAQLQRGVAIGLNNKTLAQQIQLALLRFSILSSLLEYNNKQNKYTKKHRFTVDITEKYSLELFRKYISFTSKDKQRKLNNIIKQKSNTSYVRQIIVPGTQIMKILKQAGYVLKKQFPKVSNFFNNNRMMSKQTFKNSILQRIKNKKIYKKLKQILNYPILPVKINKIKTINKNIDMIDISVKNRNFIANGLLVHNSAARFQRLREEAAKSFYGKIAEAVNQVIDTNKNVEGIIVGGPGPTKEEFVKVDDLRPDVKKKIIAVKDITYTDESGLNELLNKSQDVLAREEIAKEKEKMQRFFDTLNKNIEKASYGFEQVKQSLDYGAVDQLLISEELDTNKADELIELAQKYGTQVSFISTLTPEGKQLEALGGVGAILRYALKVG